MSYATPVETLIPGVQGRVLGVLARSESELTMRTVARLGGVSVNRAVAVLNELVALGVVRRRDAGTAALVCLDRENEAARSVLALQATRESVIDRLRSTATEIDPAPASVVLFGSFARGVAGVESDVDVLAVPPRGLSRDVEAGWHDDLGQWAEHATRIAGNPVNLVVVSLDELPGLLDRREGPWGSVVEEGIVLCGVPPDELVSSAA